MITLHSLSAYISLMVPSPLHCTHYHNFPHTTFLLQSLSLTYWSLLFAIKNYLFYLHIYKLFLYKLFIIYKFSLFFFSFLQLLITVFDKYCVDDLNKFPVAPYGYQEGGCQMRDSGPGISVGCKITCCKLWSVLSQSMLLDSMLVKSGVSDAKLPPT